MALWEVLRVLSTDAGEFYHQFLVFVAVTLLAVGMYREWRRTQQPALYGLFLALVIFVLQRGLLTVAYGLTAIWHLVPATALQPYLPLDRALETAALLLLAYAFLPAPLGSPRRDRFLAGALVFVFLVYLVTQSFWLRDLARQPGLVFMHYWAGVFFQGLQLGIMALTCVAVFLRQGKYRLLAACLLSLLLLSNVLELPIAASAAEAFQTALARTFDLVAFSIFGFIVYRNIVDDARTARQALQQLNQELDRKVAERTRELSTLLQAGEALSSTLDLDSRLDIITAQMTTAASASGCLLALLDEDEGHITVRSGFDSVSHSRTPNVGVKRTLTALPLMQRVLRGETIVIEPTAGVPTLSGEERAIADGLGAKSAVLLPLLVRGKSIGIVFLYESRTPRRFSPEELRLYTALAHQAAVAIENARLYASVVESRNELEAIIQNSADGVFALDRQRRIVSFNPALENLTGWQVAEVLGTPCSLVLQARDLSHHSLCEQNCLCLRAFSSQQPLTTEVLITTKDGRELNAGISLGPILDQAGRVIGAVGVVRDITRQKEVERLQTELVSTTSHELRTPLTLIKGYLGTLLRPDLRLQPETQTRFLRQIDEAANRLTGLVDDLLSVSRLESGQMELRLQPVDLAALVNRVVSGFAVQGDGQRLSLSLGLLPDHLMVRADAEQIERILLNLLNNAVKFSPQGGHIQVSGCGVRVEHGQVAEAVPGPCPLPAPNLDDGAWALVSVQDEGIGIPPEHQERIFEKFYQVDSGLTRRARGTGLGLYICKGIIEAHGGKIWVDSAPGQGSTFVFDLPWHFADS